MAMNLAAIRDMLLPGLNTLFGDYAQIPTQWSRVFDRTTSNMAIERDLEVRLLGLAQLRTEGQSTYFDNGMGQRSMYNYYHKGIGLGFIVTRSAIKDNLYKTQFKPNATALRNSFQQTKEIYGANILNKGTTYDATVGGDGKALFATDHPIDTGTVANTPTTQAELNETSLQNALIAIRKFRNVAGLKFMSRGRLLIVPVELEYTAQRLMQSELRVGTADNDLNAIKSLGKLPEGFTAMDFLTDTKAWFIKTDSPDGFKYFDREPFESDVYVDFDTDNLKVKGYERYSFGYSNFRCAYGNFPT